MDPIFKDATRVVFVWLDLEMTGINPDTERIVEVASVLTTPQLDVIAEGPSLVVNQPESFLQNMEPVVTRMHKESGLLERVRQSHLTVEDAQRATIDFLHKHFDRNTIFQLAGNSVYQDRAFIRRYMPELDQRLHYRLIDVSTIKSLVRYWYPNSDHARLEKQERHRALDDVYESIDELRHYRRHFFV